MKDIIKFNSAHNAADERLLRKLHNKHRLGWHEKLIMTEVGLRGRIARYAAWIMHDKKFKLSKRGFVELSTRTAAKELRMDRRTVQRANHWLVARSWLVPILRHGHETQRYRLGNGPVAEAMTAPAETTEVATLVPPPLATLVPPQS